MKRIRKSGYEQIAAAISRVEMPDLVRYALVDELVSTFEKEDDTFRAALFSAQCGVYGCDACEYRTASKAEHYRHMAEEASRVGVRG